MKRHLLQHHSDVMHVSKWQQPGGSTLIKSIKPSTGSESKGAILADSETCEQNLVLPCGVDPRQFDPDPVVTSHLSGGGAFQTTIRQKVAGIVTKPTTFITVQYAPVSSQDSLSGISRLPIVQSGQSYMLVSAVQKTQQTYIQ